MALALDATTPAFVSGTTSPATTASFTPPAGAKLIAMALADSNNTFTVAGGSLTWTLINSSSGANGSVYAWWADIASSAAMTVAATKTGSFTACAIKVIVLTGATAGASGIGVKSANNTFAVSAALTLTSSNSWVWAVVEDNNSLISGGATGNTIDTGPTAFGGIQGAIVKSTANPTGASASSFTSGVTGATAPALAAFEVIGSGAGAAPAVARYPRLIDRAVKVRVLR